MRDDIFQAILAEVRQIHEYRNTGGKFDEFFLNQLTLRFIFLLLIGEFFFLLRCELFSFILCLLYCIGQVDDCLNIGIQAAESFDAHKCAHCILIGHKPRKCFIIHIDEQGAFPTTSQQRRRSSRHSNIKYVACGYLLHGATVISNDRQEIDKFLNLLFWVTLVHIKATAVIAYLFQCAIQRKIEHITLVLHNLTISCSGINLPRALHTKSCLKVCFRA
ncbi:MAG: hypothetical protein A4E53_00538 [Pelotomaculum sp. PtaB.Bin104]|nr:MAG: hypothetical protein A4E53_00538 [Pelotomaculum sp. PtaB.Bin104]